MKIKNFKICLIVTTTLLFLSLIPEITYAKSMEFKLIQPNEPMELFGNAWQIFADGELDSESPQRLQRLIDTNKIPNRSRIYLNSNGGSLSGGIELGKVIRKNGLYTDVGKLDGVVEESKLKGIIWKNPIISPTECVSACVFAYMGGEFRFLKSNSNLGVHRFYAGNVVMDSDITQIASSYVLQYINSMGVNEAVFHEMVKAGKDEVNILTKILASKLNLVNEGYGTTAWSIESITGGIYVKGERNTWRGLNKFLIACDSNKKKLFQTFIFDTEGRNNDLSNMQSVSIFLNSKQIPIEKYVLGKPLIANNIATVMMMLPNELLNKFVKVEIIGIAFQYNYEAPFFLGFNEMNLFDGKEKIENVIKLCSKG